MSFFSGTGFGANNNQNQQSNNAFSGFGQSNTNPNTTGGFGSSNNTGFGSGNNATGGSLFGGTNASGGFGGFGSNNNQPSTGFGDRPAFGATSTSTGGSLFGGNTATTSSGFGSLGNNNTATGFGTSTNSGGLFGQTPKPAFGSGTGSGTATSLFGPQNTNTGFGSGTTNSTTGFGASNTTGFGATQNQNQGTGNTPFQAHTEQEGTGGGKAHFQSIVFQQPYQHYSFEELRLADYNQGRKWGNQSGQAGAFGTSTGFGGFGGATNNNTGFGTTNANGGGLFGQTGSNATSSATPFGTTNTNAFGSSTNSGGLFGANKPTSLFGGTTATSGASSGSLFGTSNNATTTTGFGNTGGFSSSNTGTSLFGNANNNQAKPAFGFGNSATPTTGGFGQSTGGFGQPSTNTGSIFGNNNNNNAQNTNTFGQNQSNTSTGFGAFGQANNQNQNNSTSGGLFGSGGGFGNNTNQNQPKPGLFGGGGTSLFGNAQNQQQQPQTGGIFGNTAANSNQQNTSLFGAKPATTGTSLFGGVNNASGSGGGGLFSLGNQQPQGTSLFGGNNQSQQKPSLFGTGNTANNNTSGNSLFGGFGQSGNNQALGSSLFNNTNNNQGQQSQFGGGLFGSQQNQQQTQPQQLMTSINSTNPYGNEHLFVSLATPPQSVGPLATPLSSSQKARKPTPLPTYKLNPAASSRLITPQKRSGYGFSYSNYGTPGSATSNASSSPFSSGLLGSGNHGRTLNKSYSTNNLRGTMGGGDSILAPGAFSPSGARSFNGPGSIKKLNINRTLRTDLFGNDSPSEPARPSPLKKRVSFENETTRPGQINGETSTTLVRVNDRDSETPQAEDLTSADQATSKSLQSNGVVQPEMSQIKGNELAIVPEDGPPPVTSKRTAKTAAENARLNQTDIPPGDYYTIPSMAELRKMTRSQLSSVKPFTVGREGSGKIEFSNVNLNDVDLSKICDNIVKITTRKATVYLDNASKPPPGKQLNVPAIVTLGNSWPRAKGGRLPVYEKKGPRFEKHLLRLKRVDGTEFISYNEKSGEWSFRVDHFSTYALNYEDDSFMSSMLTPPPETPVPKSSAQESTHSHDQPSITSEQSSNFNANADDTFAFRSRKSLPGAFEGDGVSDFEDEISSPLYRTSEYAQLAGQEEEDSMMRVKTQGPSTLTNPQQDIANDLEMAGSFPNLDGPVDLLGGRSPPKLKSIMKQSHRLFPTLDSTPSRERGVIDGDWAQQLQRTISPKKQDRHLLREFQGSIRKESPEQNRSTAVFDKATNPFATSIDVMNSLFGNDGGKKGRKGYDQSVEAKSFKSQNSKTKTDHDDSMNDGDLTFHESVKPNWTSIRNTISFTTSHETPEYSNGIFVDVMRPLDLESKVVRFGGFIAAEVDLPDVFQKQRALTNIVVEHGVPRAYMRPDFTFSTFASLVDATDPKSRHEQLTWRLAGILFDEDEAGGVKDGSLEHDLIRERSRKQRLSMFWKDLVHDATQRHASKASSAEEKAVAFISGEKVPEACKALLEGRDFRLATQLALIGGNENTKKGMASQIVDWRRMDILSEITAPIRTLYELLSGNACISEGKSGAGPENRAESFKISSRFGLDWRRSFGLRLWYVAPPDGTVADAVDAYRQDQETGDEDVKPIPWFVEQDLDVGWEDPDRFSREDILWGLLKIYSNTDSDARWISEPDGDHTVKLEDIIAPHNISGNPMDGRLSFQLYHCLHARSIAEFSTDLRDQKADQLANDYAFQLTNSGHLAPAIFVSLHISDPDGRQAAIKSLLNLCAAHSTVEELEKLARDLGSAFKIPEAWFWSAKAPFIKAVDQDEVALVRCLLRAGEISEAHRVLKSSVAPRAVIEEDLFGLKKLIAAWDPELRTMDVLPEWGLGGGVYVDYIQLLELRKKGPGNLSEKSKLLEGIVSALSTIGSQMPGLEELVAISEMSKLVLEVALDLEAEGGVEAIDRAKLRALPVPKDGVLKDVLKLSGEYYSASAFDG